MLNKVEEQILLWVESYPGISEKEIEDRHLDCDIAIRIRETIRSLVSKGRIVDRNDELVSTRIMEEL